MAESSWQGRVPYIVDGEPVDENVANRPLEVLAQREQYLKDRIDSAEFGEAVAAFGSTLSSTVGANFAVAWNVTTQRFEPALAQAVVDPATGSFVPGPVADCIGVCSDKSDATFGTVVLSGRFRTTLAGAVDGSPVPGRYYLSSAEPGKLTRQKPPVTVPVLYWDGTYAYVGPTLSNFLDSHVHYRFDLACQPAGTATVGGGRQGIDDPDDSLRGWLPADHAGFDGKAPAGAVFGYNLAADADLDAIWPPTPVDSAVFVWDKGLGVGGVIVERGFDGLVVADVNGIWWLSDCDGEAPWLDTYPEGSFGSSIGGDPCPRPTTMRLYVSFTEMLFETDKTVVTDLSPAAGSPITVTNCTGTPAKTGSLLLGLDLDFLTDGDLVNGALVFKALDGTTFKRGHVVEGLIAGANVTLTPTDSVTVAGSSPPVNQGRVRIDVDTNLAERELVPQIIRLNEAVERPFQDVLYIGFPANRDSAIRMRMNVPYAGLPGSPTVKIRLLLYAATAGTLPATTMSYLRLPRPATGVAVTLPSGTTPVACNTNVSVAAGKYIEVESAAIGVVAGDTLIVNFARSRGDGYTGEVGVLRAGGVLLSG